MVGTPFLTFYVAGLILGANFLVLIKMFLLTCLYIVLHFAGQLVYDDRLMALLPLSIYLATKLWMYVTWIVYIMPRISFLTSVVFLSSSGALWFFFIKSWLGDPGVICPTQEQRFRVIWLLLLLKLDQLYWFEVADNYRIGGKRWRWIWTVDILFGLFGSSPDSVETLLGL